MPRRPYPSDRPGRVVIALLYRRVSTGEQSREGQSLSAQASQTRRYALARGWIIGGEYEDVLSGLRADRPQYQALLAEARRLRASGTPTVVTVAWMDRFGRSVLERARAAEELRTIGVPVHATMEGGLVPELVANLLAAVAQAEVRHLSSRSREIRRYFEEHGWRPPSPANWGYRRRPSTPQERGLGAPGTVLDIDPAQAPYVQQTFRRAADGERVSAIIRWLQSLPEDARGGRSMGPPAIYKMLAAPVYVARAAHGDTDVLNRPVNRWPALVDDATWTRVQERIKHGRMPARQSRPPAILQGLIRCPCCGAAMGAAHRRRRKSLYQCSGYKAGAGAPNVGCSESAQMSQVDTLVLTEASNLVARIGDPMSGSAVFRGAWEAMSGHSERSPATRLNDLDQQAATIKGQWARAALDLVDGRRQVSSYRQLRDDALAQLEAIEVGRRPRDGELPDAVQLLEMASALRATFGGDDSRAQGQGLALLVERVVPRRRRRNEYAVEIQWTPLAEAIRRCAEACGGAEPLIDAAPRVHEADHSDPGYSTT